MSSSKNPNARRDAEEKALSEAWNMPLNAAREIRRKQIEGGSPSVMDVMPDIIERYNSTTRRVGELCVGTRWLRSVEQPSYGLTTVRNISGKAVPCRDYEVMFEPVFARFGSSPQSRSNGALGISGGKNSGKTTMLHSLIEQAIHLTSAHETRIFLVEGRPGSIPHRISSPHRIHYDARDDTDEMRSGMKEFDLGSQFNPAYGGVQLNSSIGEDDLVFVDDMDLFLQSSPENWRHIAYLAEKSNLVFTTSDSSPQALPRKISTYSGWVTLEGGKIPDQEDFPGPWSARYRQSKLHDTATHDYRITDEEQIIPWSDLPKETSPIKAHSPMSAFVERTGVNTFVDLPADAKVAVDRAASSPVISAAAAQACEEAAVSLDDFPDFEEGMEGWSISEVRRHEAAGLPTVAVIFVSPAIGN